MPDLLLPPAAEPAPALADSAGAPIFIVGTTQATWLPLARALWRHWTQFAPHAGGVVPDTAIDPMQMAARQPEARFIVCVESPVAALLAAWAEEPSSSACAAEVIARWSARAQQLLTLVHRHRDRCLCIATDDFAGAPAALAAALSAWEPALAQLPADLPVPAVAGAVRRALAEAAVQSSVIAAGQHAELAAACVELGPQTSGAPDVDAAVRDLHELETARATAEAAQLSATSRATTLGLDLQRTQAQAQEELARAEAAARRALGHAQAEAREEHDLLVLQLHRAQEDLEQHHLRVQALEADLAQALSQPRPDPALGLALAEAREDNQWLLLQLHQVQEELEQYYLRLKEREEQPAAATAHRVTARWARLGHAVHEPPHRHLDVEFGSIAGASIRLDRLALRLVEHGGRPGLLLFGAGGLSGPLAAWAPNGHEGERPFMLLVPGDDEGRRRLERLGTRDWLLVCGLVDLLCAYLASAGALQAPWLAVAARLSATLVALPPRWRYDTLDCQPDPEQPDALQVDFGAALFGDRLLGDTRMRWQPGRQRLSWRAPADAGIVPVAGWPAGADGRLVPEWALPVGAADASVHQRQRWAALAATEQRMLLGLLDALPATAERMAGAAVTLRHQAQALRRDAQRAWLQQRIAQLLRRVLRRGPR